MTLELPENDAQRQLGAMASVASLYVPAGTGCPQLALAGVLRVVYGSPT